MTGPAGARVPPVHAALATSLQEEHDYCPRIAGILPAGLRGTLYRNGPGRFERGSHRLRHLLDGDGMVQAFSFAEGRVRFRNRFVQTHKFRREELAGRALYATWSTLAPGGSLANIGGRAIRSQAGVTVLRKQGALYAFGEVGRPYMLDPDTLDTLGERSVNGSDELPHCKAHSRTDGETSDWVLFGTVHGRRMTLWVEVRGADGALRRRFSVPAPRQVYIHDMLVTARHVVFVLHPALFRPWGFLTGRRSFIDCLHWIPAEGNAVLVVDKDGATPPLLLEAPAVFMWHGLNAYEEGGTIVADFVGYDAPDHFIGPDAALQAMMTGGTGRAESPGRLRRYVIDPGARTLRTEVLAGESCEFPGIDPRRACRRHRIGYVATAPEGSILHDGLARIDLETGQSTGYRFGPGYHVGEPVFAPDPAAGDAPDAGWLMSTLLDGAKGRSRLVIFRAEDLSSGPVAQVLLDHHLPFGFHGCWHAG